MNILNSVRIIILIIMFFKIDLAYVHKFSGNESKLEINLIYTHFIIRYLHSSFVYIILLW